MADNTTQATTEDNTQAQEAQTQVQGGARMFTQEEVNRLVGDARTKERKKYEGFEDYKAKAEATADYDDIKAERDRLTAEVEKRDLLDKVSTSTGVPKNLIHGETEEQMMASAQALNTYIESLKPSYPQDKGGAKSAKPLTKEEILKIEDTEARMAAIAQHIELF